MIKATTLSYMYPSAKLGCDFVVMDGAIVMWNPKLGAEPDAALVAANDAAADAAALQKANQMAIDNATVQAFKTAKAATPADIANALQALIHVLRL